MEPNKDKEEDKQSRPGIPPPGEQPDQQQQPFAPPQPQSRQPPSASSQWTPPSGNPDLYPAGHAQQRIDLRERNPLEPQGMLYDPRQLLDQQRSHRPDMSGVPPRARFDPFGPPDPDMVGPGRGPHPSGAFGNPDPDHFQPPGQSMPPDLARKSLKSLKDPSRFPPGPPSGRPGGGLGGGPFGGF